MTEQTDDNDDGINRFHTILLDNYRLFAILGVFGALSVYFTNFGGEQNLIGVNRVLLSIGSASSLLLFILTTLLIDMVIVSYFSSLRHFLRYILWHRDGVLLGMFTILINLMTLSIGVILIQFRYATLLIGSFLSFIIGMTIQFEIIYLIGDLYFDDFTEMNSQKAVFAIVSTFFLMIVSGILLFVTATLFEFELVPSDIKSISVFTGVSLSFLCGILFKSVIMGFWILPKGVFTSNPAE